MLSLLICCALSFELPFFLSLFSLFFIFCLSRLLVSFVLFLSVVVCLLLSLSLFLSHSIRSVISFYDNMDATDVFAAFHHRSERANKWLEQLPRYFPLFICRSFLISLQPSRDGQ